MAPPNPPISNRDGSTTLIGETYEVGIAVLVAPPPPPPEELLLRWLYEGGGGGGGVEVLVGVGLDKG